MYKTKKFVWLRRISEFNQMFSKKASVTEIQNLLKYRFKIVKEPFTKYQLRLLAIELWDKSKLS